MYCCLLGVGQGPHFFSGHKGGLVGTVGTTVPTGAHRASAPGPSVLVGGSSGGN